MISLAQNGKEMSVANLTTPTPAPNLGPVTLPPDPDSGWAIPPMERARYDGIFESLNPVNGLLAGDKVKPVLLNSKLPVEVLGRVWELSDIDKDGYLDRQEFSVAMHLVYKALEKEPVPPNLPPELIPPSKKKPAGTLVGAVPVLPDLAAAAAGRASPIATGTASPVMGRSAASASVPWVVPVTDRGMYDALFKKADTDMDGLVNGLEVKDIFLQTGVPQPTLAHIWNLCDTRGLGKLNSEQFSLAMYLINQHLKGMEAPQQLSPEMIPPSLRQSDGMMNGAAVGIVTDSATMKELDMISKEIEELKRQKMKLEQDKAQADADIKIRTGEVVNLEKEVDAINATVKQLESQKGEARKRLDELDDKRTKMESELQDLRDKCQDEQNQIQALQSNINSQEASVKVQEGQLQQMRGELSTLRQEEAQLEQRVEAGRNQLDQLARSLSEAQTQMTQSKARIKHLEESHKDISHNITQYDRLLNGDKDAVEPVITIPVASPPSASNDIIAPSAPSAPPVVNNNSMSSVGNVTAFDDFKEDPFKDKDPFSKTDDMADPFKNADPFKESSTEDPFKSDPFKSDGFSADPFGNDPFKGAFGSSKDKQGDPFKEDPFGGAFSSTAAQNTSESKLDPFDPFGGGSGSSTNTSQFPSDDPFGSDPFAPSSAKSSSPAVPGGSPSPALPPKRKAPPRPPAPKKGGVSPTVPRAAAAKPTDDPFGGSDPFAASSGNSGTDAFSGFADFSPGKFGSEEEQVQWAQQESQRAEKERQQRISAQEQADLELAIALSKQES